MRRDPLVPVARRERHESLLEQPVWLTLSRVLPIAGLVMAVNGFVRSGLRTREEGETTFEGFTGSWGVVILLALALLLYGCVSLLVTPRPAMWISSLIVMVAGYVLVERVDDFRAHLQTGPLDSDLVTDTTFGGPMELVPRGGRVALVTGGICFVAALGYGVLRVYRKRRHKAALRRTEARPPVGV